MCFSFYVLRAVNNQMVLFEAVLIEAVLFEAVLSRYSHPALGREKPDAKLPSCYSCPWRGVCSISIPNIHSTWHKFKCIFEHSYQIVFNTLEEMFVSVTNRR